MANALTPYDPQIWLGETLMLLHDHFVYAGIVHRDFEDKIASHGQTASTRQPAIFTANTKGATANVTVQDATAANVDVVLDQHKEVTFQIFDVEASRSFKDLVAEYIEPSAIAHADGIDSALAGQYANATNAYTVGAVMSKSVLPGARRRMLVNQVPFDGRVSMVLSPISEEALLNDATFIESDKVGDDGTAMREASLGRKYGFNVFMGQNTNTTSGSPDVSNNMAKVNLSG